MKELTQEQISQAHLIDKALVKKYKKLCLLLPTYKIIPTNTYHCMMVFLSQLYRLGFNVSVLMLDQTNVVLARNNLCKHFIETHEKNKFDLTLWMDSDHDFKTSDFMTMLYHYDKCNTVDILSARYVTRDNIAPRVCAYNKKNDGYMAIHPDNTGISEVDGVGFGFIMMSPKVMVDMHNEYGLRQFEFVHITEKGPEIISEDLTWCDRAKKIGYKVFVDNEINVGHYGGTMTIDFLKYIKGYTK